MPKIDEAILDYVRRTGPSTPIEIAQKVRADSIIVSAILVDAIDQKKILKSKRRIGSDKIYYFPDQRGAMEKRVNASLKPEDKELLQVLMNHKVLAESDVDPRAISMLANLEDLIGAFVLQDDKGGELKCWKVPNITDEQAKDVILKRLFPDEGKATPPMEKEKTPEPKPAPTPEPKPDPKQPEKQTQLVPKPEPPAKKNKPNKEVIGEDEREQIRREILAEMKGSFRDNVLNWFEKQDIDIIDETVIKEGQEVELHVKVPTPLGRQNYFVKIFDYPKKSASQNDVSTVGMDALSRRTPAIIISSTGFAKSAVKHWKKELEDLVTLVSEEDLE